MSNESVIKVFEDKSVRIVWNEQEEKYYFSIADIVQILTDSTDVKQYIKRMRARDPELNFRWGTICTPTRMQAADGKFYQTQAADLENIFRIIQSVPSKKAEPVKQWLASIGAQRIDQMIDPEQTFQMAVEDYRRQGYSDKWINARMRSIRDAQGTDRRMAARRRTRAEGFCYTYQYPHQSMERNDHTRI